MQVQEQVQQLSCLSRDLEWSSDRMVPRCFMFEHSVEYGKQLAHTGRDCQLLGLPCREQMLIEVSNDGIVPGGHQCSHVEGRSYDSSATPNSALTPDMTAIPVERSHSYQGCNLLAIKQAQFREISQDSGGKHRPNSRYALEQIVFLFPDGGLSNAMSQIIIDLDHLFFQPSDMSSDMCFDSLATSRVQTVSLCRKHLYQLTPPGHDSFQFLPLSVRQRTRCGMNSRCKVGQHFGINAIGLSQAPCGPGKIPHHGEG